MLRPCALQEPKIEARVILVSVPWLDRVPPLILRLVTTGRRLRSAVRLRRIVRRHSWMSHENEEFLDVVFHASAQLGLQCRRVIPVGLAQRQQASHQGQLGPATWFLSRMSTVGGLAVDTVDLVCPPCQPVILGVEETKVMDVP